MIKLKDILEDIMSENCWGEEVQQGLTRKGNKMVSNCIRIREEKKKNLWANIRAQRARGEKPAKKGSKEYKQAVKAAKEINKNK